jgi:type I restriction enzyme S subunit
MKALRKQIFSELLLDKEPNLQIKDVLEYEQPTKYLVSNTEYSDDVTLIPVLTANKAFILGYTDEINGIYSKGKCIILDDFTLDCKLVDFPFKVKSSAIKILTAKRGANIRYLYEYLKFLDLGTSEHKRHYIAEIEPLEIVMPDINIANNIANALELMDKRIYLAENMLIQYRQQKQFLLQQMFI